MKKIFFFSIFVISLFFLFGGFQQALASSITVTYPTGGESWEQGSTQEISWECSGVDNIYIYLYKENYLYKYITQQYISIPANCPNNSFSWNISPYLEPGQYKIVISSTNVFPSDESGYFSITGESPAPAGTPHIDSISPIKGPSDTLITIIGENFNPDKASNFVGFCEGDYCYTYTWGAIKEASATQLKVWVPYLAEGLVKVIVESMTTSGRTRSDNSATFTITEACSYVSTGKCECIPTTLIEGGCSYPGKCASECGKEFAGKYCENDIDCTPESQCNLPKRCTEVGQSCTVFGAGWQITPGNCPETGQRCCEKISAAPAGPSGPRTGCPTEGLVPCGTPGCPCQFCDFFVMINNIVEFVMGRLVPAVAALMLVIGGVLFFFAGASPNTLRQAKGIITSVIIGLLIIFCAWVIVNTILEKSGIVDPVAGKNILEWWKIECR